jgi:hypothetical protein
MQARAPIELIVHAHREAHRPSTLGCGPITLVMPWGKELFATEHCHAVPAVDPLRCVAPVEQAHRATKFAAKRRLSPP